MGIMTSISNSSSPASDCREQTSILQINALRKSYGKLIAVQKASFAVYPQQVFCLVGPNGAGKTSIIDCIVGLKKPDSGDIHLFGENIPDLRRRKDIRSRIGIQFQEDSLYHDIRVKEALRLYAKMYQNPVDPDELIDIFELQRQQKTAYKDLSGGEKRRLLIAIALVGKPALLILDEPSSNLDPAFASATLGCPESLSHSRSYHYHDHPQHARSPAVQRCGLRDEQGRNHCFWFGTATA